MCTGKARENLTLFKGNCSYTAFSRTGIKVIKLFSYLTQLSRQFILLTIVGILTFIRMINTTSGRLEASNICRYFSFYEQLKFRAQLS